MPSPPYLFFDNRVLQFHADFQENRSQSLELRVSNFYPSISTHWKLSKWSLPGKSVSDGFCMASFSLVVVHLCTTLEFSRAVHTIIILISGCQANLIYKTSNKIYSGFQTHGKIYQKWLVAPKTKVATNI